MFGGGEWTGNAKVGASEKWRARCRGEIVAQHSPRVPEFRPLAVRFGAGAVVL